MGLRRIATLVCTAAVVTASYSNRPDDAGRFTFAALYDQSFLEGCLILKHVGGLGSCSNRMSYGIGRDPPESCTVDQVNMIRRHGERYPQESGGEDIEAVLKKLYAFDVENWKGDLTFLNWWHGFERVVQTARTFGEGFFGWNYTNSVALNIISESDAMGANSLTSECPGNTDAQNCHSLSHDMREFRVAAERFNKQNPGLIEYILNKNKNKRLNSTDVYQLIFMSVFELNVRGYSDWTNALTLDEWKWFGYTQNLNFYYCAAPEILTTRLLDQYSQMLL
ncbi:3-phytase B [Penicillium maclennaniae]|uniref:3-phytase B n=1 Tax=Penicillium maclennaniae TaxID=1343394 RepID=UPI00254009C5|nr:3-phytase B [Penicillium maclennaniae]KAJ5677943.1 3-phytase B [Penicillium maclennaniae]